MLGVASSLTSCGSQLLNAFKLSTSALSATFITPVRYRYHKDKPEILKRRWGYVDKMGEALKGTLPRVQSSKPLPLPTYVPGNSWSERKALFGQNDYIDILGDDESIHPIKFAYGVPGWLRGFRGHEYHMLLRKRAYFGAKYRAAYPLTHHFMNKRLKYLYRRLNYKTKSNLDTSTFHR